MEIDRLSGFKSSESTHKPYFKSLANYLGIATETISRVLSCLQEKSWLKINGRELTPINMAAMEELLQGSRDEW